MSSSSKRSRSSRKPNELDETEIHKALSTEKQKVQSNFLRLDLVLNGFKSRSRTGTWYQVCEAVKQSSDSDFTLEDLAILLMISPHSYKLAWQITQTENRKDIDYQLCIMINSEGTLDHSINEIISSTSSTSSKSSSTTTTALSSSTTTSSSSSSSSNKRSLSSIEESRLNAFSSQIDYFFDKMTHPFKCNADMSVIPMKPVNQIQQHGGQIVKKVSSIAAGEREKSSAVAKEELGKTTGLDELRQVIAQRGLKAIELEVKNKECHQALELSKKLKSLPSLFDVLRNISVTKNRSTRPMSEFLNETHKDLNISKLELRSRLELMSNIVPEFLTICSPNEVVNEEALRINLYAPFKAVREKLRKQKV